MTEASYQGLIFALDNTNHNLKQLYFTVINWSHRGTPIIFTPSCTRVR